MHLNDINTPGLQCVKYTFMLQSLYPQITAKKIIDSELHYHKHSTNLI
jgi:hypothetical protein